MLDAPALTEEKVLVPLVTGNQLVDAHMDIDAADFGTAASMEITDAPHEPLLSMGSVFSALPSLPPVQAPVSTAFADTPVEDENRSPFLAPPQPAVAHSASTSGPTPVFAPLDNTAMMVGNELPLVPTPEPVAAEPAPTFDPYPVGPLDNTVKVGNGLPQLTAPEPVAAQPVPAFDPAPVSAALDDTAKKVTSQEQAAAPPEPVTITYPKRPAVRHFSGFSIAPPAPKEVPIDPALLDPALLEAPTPAPVNFGLAAPANAPSNSAAAAPVAFSFDFSAPGPSTSPVRNAKRRSGARKTQAQAPAKAPAAAPAPVLPGSATMPPADPKGKGKATFTESTFEPDFDYLVMNAQQWTDLATKWIHDCYNIMFTSPVFAAVDRNWMIMWRNKALRLLTTEFDGDLSDIEMDSEFLSSKTKRFFQLTMLESGGPDADGRNAVLRHVKDLAAMEGIDVGVIEM
ncbi:hypothetical protein VTJ49DRAFT_471 [Mycothermus thermophilus]|uniref:Uncharacterized protein n=1 Tax=Humicola insolens TaxID=85995 RepID=A0ABR3VFI3_HUMIN